MAKIANKEAPELQKLFWFRIGRFLILVVLAIGIYLLGLSMVHHRFFRGGYVDQHGVLKP
jgi:hypothetical protein